MGHISREVLVRLLDQPVSRSIINPRLVLPLGCVQKPGYISHLTVSASSMRRIYYIELLFCWTQLGSQQQSCGVFNLPK